MSTSGSTPPPLGDRDLGAELCALNDQLRQLSRREADRLQGVLDNDQNLTEDERSHLREEIARFRVVEATELD